MVAKRTVVGVLLNSHNLNGVVAQFHDAWQHLGAKFLVRAYCLLVLRHTDVALVDEQRIDRRHEVVYLKLVGLFRAPNLRRENLSGVVLHHACGVGWDAFAPTAIPVHMQLKEVAVRHGAFRQVDFPVSVGESLHAVGFTLCPFVEWPHDVDVGGIWRPFTECPSIISAVQAIVIVGVCKIAELALAGKFLHFFQRIFVSALNCRRKRLKPRVVFDNRK